MSFNPNPKPTKEENMQKRKSEGRMKRLFIAAKRLLSAASGRRSGRRSHSESRSSRCEDGRRDPLFAMPGTVDLADLPEIWDNDRLAIFFAECSQEFPGRRTISLPLETIGNCLVSAPSLKAALRLIRRLRRADLVILSIRALVDNRELSDSRLTTIVLD